MSEIYNRCRALGYAHCAVDFSLVVLWRNFKYAQFQFGFIMSLMSYLDFSRDNSATEVLNPNFLTYRYIRNIQKNMVCEYSGQIYNFFYYIN